MVLTSVAPAPSFADRFRAAWRGDESLAWVFWSFYFSVGICLSFIQLALSLVVSAISGGEFGQFQGSPVDSAFGVLADVVELGYFGVAFILFVRCISNVRWRGWHYAAMLFLLGISYQVIERARDVGAVLLGV